VAGDGELSIALDTALDRPLLGEGAARDLVRALNQLRKDADLALDQRIRSVVEAPAELDADLADGGWYDVVARDGLAVGIERTAGGADPAIALTSVVDLGELGVARIGIVHRS
jgi:hypothetical protein